MLKIFLISSNKEFALYFFINLLHVPIWEGVKKILISSFIILAFNVQAIEELPKQIADDVREYVTSFIPGEGPTEVSLELRENYKPDFSVLGVRELDRNDSGNTFWQFSFHNTEKNNRERLVGNLGLGKRYLTNNWFLL